MAHENQDDGLMRRYLLGRLAEDERQQFEEKMMVDNELFNRVLLAEDEMVEEYLERELPESDRAEFEASFLSTPEGRQQVSFAKALSRHVKEALLQRREVPIATDQREEVVNAFAAGASAGPQVEKEQAPAEPQQRGSVSRPVWWSRLAATPYFGLAAAAMIVLAVGSGTWRAYEYFQHKQASKGIASLRDAYRDQRPTEARISELNYAPPPPTTRGPEPDRFDYVALDRAKALIQLEASEHPSARSYHDLGRLYLAERDFDKAIDQFEKAIKLDEKNAQLHSDLGAALLEKGKANRLKGETGTSLQEFAQSDEYLTKALELNPSLLEALFNRALCLEYMLLRNESEKAWRTYLEKESSSTWAEEARQRLRELEQRPRQTSLDKEQLFRDFLEAHKSRNDARAWQLISQNRDSTGGLIENMLIDSYLNAASRGNDEANQSLEGLSYAGRLASERAGDLFSGELARFYKSANQSRLDEAVRARSLLSKGRDSVSRYNFAEALGFYNEAKETFEKVGDECEATLTAYAIGNCDVQQSRAETALSIFQPLAQVCEREGYRWLLSQALYASANANLYLRDFTAAMENSKRSMELAKEMGDAIGLVRTSYQFAEEHRYINAPREALDLHAQGLPLANMHTPRPADLWRVYFSVSLTLDQLNLPRSSIDFQKEALQLAVEAGAPRFICRSYNYLGALLAKSGSYAEATTNLQRALEIGNSFDEREVRIEATAYSFLQLGYVHKRLGDLSKAIENYDEAIRSYDELDSKFFGYTARKEKLLCCLEQNGCSSVDQETETVLNLFEEHRSKILEESSRNTFFDAEQSIYDLIIDFEYDRKGDVRKAFEYSERSRGRSLRDLMSTNVKLVDNPLSPDVTFAQVSQPVGLAEIQTRMPADAQILQYAVLKRRVLLWVFSKDDDDFHHAFVEISNDDLNRHVNRLLHLVSQTSLDDLAEFTVESHYLYNLLIKPVENLLDRDKQLCIVPDKILNYLPFAALKAEASGEYFIEQEKRGFVLAPSSFLFVTCSETARAKPSIGAERLLIVGNPLIDRAAFPDFDDLQSAGREAKTIAGFYGDAPPIVGAFATKRKVLSEMERSDVIHLATHAVADEWYPLRSRLLLARGESGSVEADSVLQAYEIYKLNLDRAKLVVLSACRSGVEKYYGGEGMIGLSRPFLAKRIPLVVASLWPVDSDSTADLMISFQRHRKSDGQPTAEALRQAQIEMLKDTDSENSRPYHWASFVAIGGHVDF